MVDAKVLRIFDEHRLNHEPVLGQEFKGFVLSPISTFCLGFTHGILSDGYKNCHEQLGTQLCLHLLKLAKEHRLFDFITKVFATKSCKNRPSHMILLSVGYAEPGFDFSVDNKLEKWFS